MAARASSFGVPSFLAGPTGMEKSPELPGQSGPVRSTKAAEALKLTPEEKHLYQHHLENVARNKTVPMGDATATIRQISVDHNGRTYNIPTVWDGEILTNHEAMIRALKEGGWKAWPSYKSVKEAEDRYQLMHDALASDVAPREN